MLHCNASFALIFLLSAALLANNTIIFVEAYRSQSQFNNPHYFDNNAFPQNFTAHELLDSATFTKTNLRHLRDQTKQLFLHGWQSYMQHGFPNDEVRPLTCESYGPNYENRQDLRNDVLGNYSVTLLDSIDTFIIMNDYENFARGVKLIEENISFDIDSTVQVFETSIRALGGLLTCHLYASDSKRGFQLPNYNNSLLLLAYDLGQRLLPAFDTKTGIPYARINLKHGVASVPSNLMYETCTAGAGSPMLEMTMLSKLTGDPIFEKVSRNAFMALWDSRSALDLLPMSLNPLKGKWLDLITGIGASVDSFYEYALKGAILFNDEELLQIWQDSYNALRINSFQSEWFFSNINVETSYLSTYWVDSLSAFFPGLLVLGGKVSDAVRTHTLFLKIWNTFGAIPERWNFFSEVQSSSELSNLQNAVALEWYPLRPEFVESTYYLYRATKDPLYLQIGVRILKDFRYRFMAKCGFAGIQDIRTNEPQNRMESFVLSETFKYLYLLFDEDNAIHQDGSNILFSTEGHPMWLDESIIIPYGGDEMDELAETVSSGTTTATVSTASTASTASTDTQAAELPNDDNSIPREKLVYGGVIESLFEFASSKLFANDDMLDRFKAYYQSYKKQTRPSLSSSSATSKKKQVLAELAKVRMEGIENYGLEHVDKNALNREICEVNALSNDNNNNKNNMSCINTDLKDFGASKLMSWDRFYEIDQRYASTLVQPSYLKAAGYSEFELDVPFYDKWVDSKVSVCARRPTTEAFELLFGDKPDIRVAQVDEVRSLNSRAHFQRRKQSHTSNSYNNVDEASISTPVVKANDFWVPKLDGIRIRLEKLESGKVDTSNTVIKDQRISAVRHSSLINDVNESSDLHGFCSLVDCPKTLKVLMVNGRKVEHDSVVWVSPQAIKRHRNSSILLQEGKNGMVLMKNDPIENMFVYREQQ